MAASKNRLGVKEYRLRRLEISVEGGNMKTLSSTWLWAYRRNVGKLSPAARGKWANNGVSGKQAKIW